MKKKNQLPGLGEIVGSTTGEAEQSTVAGGWAGTDDATSTAPSDLIGIPQPEPEGDEAELAIRNVDQRADEEEEQRADELVRSEEIDELRELRNPE